MAINVEKFVGNDNFNMAEFNNMIDQINSGVNDVADSIPKIALGSYIGTGLYGEDNPTSLTFDFVPKILWVYGRMSSTTDVWINTTRTTSATGVTAIMINVEVLTTDYSQRGFTFSGGDSSSRIYTKKSDDEKTITWYFGDSNVASSLNQDNVEFYFMAIG